MEKEKTISGLLHRLEAFAAMEKLFTRQDTLLVAVSGGLDSVVLCDALFRLGYRPALAHCNFRLRAEESERDERFVREMGTALGLSVHVRHFETADEAAARRCGVQETARALRYAWFEELAGTLASGGGRRSRVLTAHHLDDNVETLLMNFFKGTGIAGMRGMLPDNGRVVRPLLFARREELEDYAAAAGLKWVEDSSNAEDKYSRNFIRHRILPLAESIYPRSFDNLADNLGRFRDIGILYDMSVKALTKGLLEQRGEEWHVPVEKLRKTPAIRTVTWEIIKPFGFSSGQVDEALKLLDSDSGRYILSDAYRILKNRNWLLISPLGIHPDGIYLLGPGHSRIEFPDGSLTLETHSRPPAELEREDPTGAWFDAREIRYPLILRKWRKGDYFYPLGMRKKKKIARFLIDGKCSLVQKENTWVLESDKRILWVVGMRIDDRFRIVTGTREAVHVRWKKEKDS